MNVAEGSSRLITEKCPLDLAPKLSLLNSHPYSCEAAGPHEQRSPTCSKRESTRPNAREYSGLILFFRFLFSLILNLTSRNAWLSSVLFVLEMEDLPLKSLSAHHLHSGAQCLWGRGSLQEERLGTASAMGDFSLASSGDVFVDLNTQRASKWKLRPHEKD